MPEYQFADKEGNIITEEYSGSGYFSSDQVLHCLRQAFGLFPYHAKIAQVPDCGDVFMVTFPDGADGLDSLYICAKGTTPGGRSGLKNEQRIQAKAKYFNYVYNKAVEGKSAAFLGFYVRDEQTVICAWNVASSSAQSEETPISKQVKISTIAKAIREGFAQQERGRGEFVCAFKPEFLFFYLRSSDWIHTSPLNRSVEGQDADSVGTGTSIVVQDADPFCSTLESEFARNRIVFGAPGTGKSYRLKADCNVLLNGTSGDYERVTFHPDYTFSQFVGAYKPISDEEGNIRYDFVPGPFMRTYVKALRDCGSENPQPHLLIIEEINRAKVAAVFGDVFQLLDRDTNGVSEYEIEASEDIKRFLARELGGNPEDFHRIKLPNNMFIWASMNSADQGVFPMDTAFKRRWAFEYMGINENEAQINGKIQLGQLDTQEVEWNILRKAINEKLAVEYRVNEDKLLGPFFLSKNVLAITDDGDNRIADPELFISTFKSKVIMYLYEDAAKQHKHKLFSGCPDTTKYSSICTAFDRIGIKIFGDDFIDRYYNPMKG